jgi:hypothetical protein
MYIAQVQSCPPTRLSWLVDFSKRRKRHREVRRRVEVYSSLASTYVCTARGDE